MRSRFQQEREILASLDHPNIARLLASEAAWHAGEACMQTHGGFGYAREYDVERKWREARLSLIAPISTNLILSYIGEHVLGMPRSYCPGATLSSRPCPWRGADESSQLPVRLELVVVEELVDGALVRELGVLQPVVLQGLGVLGPPDER